MYVIFDFGNSKSPFKESIISPFTEKAAYEKDKHITESIDGMFIIKGVTSSSNLYIK